MLGRSEECHISSLLSFPVGWEPASWEASLPTGSTRLGPESSARFSATQFEFSQAGLLFICFNLSNGLGLPSEKEKKKHMTIAPIAGRTIISTEGKGSVSRQTRQTWQVDRALEKVDVCSKINAAY